MAKVKQKVYLMTEQQRDALLNYLLNQPYREVAGGVQDRKSGRVGKECRSRWSPYH